MAYWSLKGSLMVLLSLARSLASSLSLPRPPPPPPSPFLPSSLPPSLTHSLPHSLPSPGWLARTAMWMDEQVRGIFDSAMWLDLEPFPQSTLTPLMEQARQVSAPHRSLSNIRPRPNAVNASTPTR
jgi:hypothetical protein